MKTVDVIKNKGEEYEDDDEGEGGVHVIADFRLPIANFPLVSEFKFSYASRLNEIGNRHSEIGNDLGVFDNHALNNIRDVLTAVYCCFEFLVNFLPFEDG